MGNRDDIEEMSSSNANVLSTVLRLIDKYDLYGQVAYPKHHKQSEVPDIYRLAAKTKVGISTVTVSVLLLLLEDTPSHCCYSFLGLTSDAWIVSYWQGVFINPALVEPFGLTLIEVGRLIDDRYPLNPANSL